jgi:hypothetical protein
MAKLVLLVGLLALIVLLAAVPRHWPSTVVYRSMGASSQHAYLHPDDEPAARP